jgi:hypothetical protein
VASVTCGYARIRQRGTLTQNDSYHGRAGIAPIRRDHWGSGNAPGGEQNRRSLAGSSQDDGLRGR